jgi:hypothetical protein
MSLATLVLLLLLASLTHDAQAQIIILRRHQHLQCHELYQLYRRLSEYQKWQRHYQFQLNHQRFLLRLHYNLLSAPILRISIFDYRHQCVVFLSFKYKSTWSKAVHDCCHCYVLPCFINNTHNLKNICILLYDYCRFFVIHTYHL